VQQRGHRVRTDSFTIAASRAHGDRARLGCVVSKKVGDAPTRARVKRLMRETFRRMADRLGPVDIVVIAKPRAAAIAASGLAPVAGELVPGIEKAERHVMRGGRRR